LDSIKILSLLVLLACAYRCSAGYSLSQIQIPNYICCVIIVNGIKPYRPATANGASGSGDYSKWSFTLVPNYTAIKAGQNKITAKYSCANSAAALSHNSVNVTGLTTSSANTTVTRAK